MAKHACYWFELKPRRREVREALPQLAIRRRWEEVFDESGQAELEAALPRYLERWTAYASGARTVLAARVEDSLPLRAGRQSYGLLVIRAMFSVGEPQLYLLPIGCRTERGAVAKDDTIATVGNTSAAAGVARVLYDASADTTLATVLFHLARERGSIAGTSGTLGTRIDRPWARPAKKAGAGHRLRRTRPGPNTLVEIGGHLVLMLFRQMDPGPNPEVGLCSYLNAAGFTHAPVLHGSLDYHPHDTSRPEPVTVGILQGYVDNAGEAWPLAVAAAEEYLRRGACRRRTAAGLIVPPIGVSGGDEEIDEAIGSYVDVIRLIALRVADLHRALAKATDPAFAPELFGPLSRRSTYQRMRTLAASVIGRLQLSRMRPAQYAARRALIANQDAAVRVFRRLVEHNVSGQRIESTETFTLARSSTPTTTS